MTPDTIVDRYVIEGSAVLPATGAPSVSLCMIVRNEEDVLARCLSSVQALVDEMVIVDTGSQDQTIEIARSFGACVFEMEWINDFAAARNRGLNEARGDWILTLDADETISPADIATLLAEVAQGDCDGLRFAIRNYRQDEGAAGWTQGDGGYEEGKAYSGYTINLLTRMFRNLPELRYQGAVHEQIEPAIEALGLRVKNTEIPIHHFGKVRGEKRLQAKSELYLQIGLEKLRKADDSNGDANLEVGLQMMELERHLEALPYLERAVELSGRSTRSCLLFADCLGALGESERALSEAAALLERVPDNPLPSVIISTVLLDQNRWQEARHHIEQGLQKWPDDQRLLQNDSVLATADQDFERAEQRAEQILRQNPHHASAHHTLGLMRGRVGQLQQAETEFKAALDLDSSAAITWTKLAETQLRQERPEDALATLERGRKSTSLADRESQLLRAQCHLALGNTEKARDITQSMLTTLPSDPEVLFLQAIGFEQAGQVGEALELYRRVIEIDPGWAPAVRARITSASQ